jgi:dihydrofolate synthase/folylpolyglutamate synthase
MEYRPSLDYLETLVNYEKTTDWQYPAALNLERMRRLAKRFGNPQNAYESILIAGSKGKGSTALLTSSILRMENYRVGLYTSPHLLDLRERIQVNGLPVSETRFAALVTQLKAILEQEEWRRDPPTYFEALTAAAFYYFKEMKVEIAVLEVGLGGLLDSTNIAPAKVVGLVPISLEHTDKLGKTVSKIAVQKCGIIKGRELVVSSPQVPEAEAVIRKTAEEREARLVRVGAEIKVFEREIFKDRQRFDLRTAWGNFFNLETHLLGAHQLENAAVAVGLVKGLEIKSRISISESAVRQGLADARWPGRLEILEERPLVLADGAQNRESARRLKEALRRHFEFEKLCLLLGVSADKDLEGILEELLPEASCLVATQSRNPRALSASAVAESAEKFGKPVFREEDSAEALAKAISLAGASDLVLATGSLYLVGELKKQNHAQRF